MKILHRNLLIAMEFFVHFCGVNSSPTYGQGSPRRNSPNLDQNVITFNINYQTRLGTIREIQVVVDTLFGHHAPMRCDLLGEPHRGIPTLDDKRAHENFITRAVYEHNIKCCVVYETEDAEVLGAKVPPPSSQEYDGEPSHLNPDNEKYFITYMGRDYQVKVWPGSGFKLDVKLLPKNGEQLLTPQFISQFDVKPFPVSFAGVHFNVYRKTKGYRGNEEYAVLKAEIRNDVI